MKQIKRETYLRKIRPFYNKQLIKIITGQRRVGKSVLLQQIMQDIKNQDPEANFVYIDKENLEFDHIQTYKDLDSYIKENSKPNAINYVFIDEVQEIAEFERTLRSYVSKPNYDIYITGSNANLLSSDLATILAGRQIVVRVYPLSFNEFIVLNDLQPDKEALLDYIKFGGLPYIAFLPREDRIIQEYLSNIADTIVYRDIIKRYQIRDANFLSQLIIYLAGVTGHLVSVNKLNNFLKSKGRKKSINTITEYLGYLENAFLVNKIDRYNITGKNVLEIGHKYYFEDIGIRNVLRGYFLEDMEKIIENAVFNHLRFLDYKIYTGWLKDREIDFVATNTQGQKLYVQVSLKITSTETLHRETQSLLKIPDNHPKILVTLDKPLFNISESGIIYYSLLDFLHKFDGIKI